MVAGIGPAAEPLRELSLSRRYVRPAIRAGSRPVEAYAGQQHLGYTDLAQVLRLVEYYNQKVAAP